MARRREVKKDEFQVVDGVGRKHTIIHISEQVDAGGLDGPDWTETMGRLETVEGYGVNKISDTDFHIPALNVDAKRIS